ncbi:hypothetical protein I7I51_02546 [Histoplasma capsulatum]|uniref:Uncharacterized protein n=1 Tax=Ajellomyces capsulatus TaxID=5037 RepID=A0A8A1MDW4_AJECA|nr:predicted protein [Histoplasma mississippiense (nom. inval.)]EDN04371.1 predicted protein [Histoplasma mississippiense (nom. inval.)]QSS62804.1 hypothetical protein I7I51_02546 [Histoplasma capsulatum]
MNPTSLHPDNSTDELWEDSPEFPEGFPSSAIGQDGEADIFGRGCLDLGTEGCGMDWYLIITGQQRGQIWLLTGEGAVPFGELFESMKVQPGFAGWALHWAAGRDLMGSDEEYSINPNLTKTQDPNQCQSKDRVHVLYI